MNSFKIHIKSTVEYEMVKLETFPKESLKLIPPFILMAQLYNFNDFQYGLNLPEIWFEMSFWSKMYGIGKADCVIFVNM